MSLNLRTVVISTFVVIIILLTVLLSSTIGNQSTRAVEDSIGTSLAEAAYQMSENLDHFMWTRSGEVEVLSKLNAFQKPVDAAEIGDLLNQLKKSFPVFSWVGYLDLEGNVLSSTDNTLLHKNVNQQSVFQEGLKGLYTGDVHEEVLLSNLLPNSTGEDMQFVDVGVPIYGDVGEVTGVLAAHLNWEWTHELESSILAPLNDRLHGVEVFVVSQKDGKILLGPTNQVGKTMVSDVLQRVAPSEKPWSVETTLNNKSYLNGYAYGDGYLSYPGLGWSVIIRQPTDEAFATVRQLKGHIVLFVIAISILFGIMSWFLAKWIARILNNNNTTIDLLSSGVETLIDDPKSDLALYDVLTGLPNRVALDAFLKIAVTEANQKQTTLSFLYLALDGFRKVNDSLGHVSGDKLMQEVAIRLQDCTRENEIVARVRGDEFIVILKTSANKPMLEAEVVATRIINKIKLPFIIEGETVYIGCSVGAAVWNPEGSDPSDTLRLANEAVYISKRNGKNQITFETAS